MTVWKNCTSDVYYSNEAPILRDPGYEVRITNDEIVVSYEGDTGWVNYTGKDLGGGHYELVAPEVDGRAMLHRYGNSKFLNGYWVEGVWHGMWRICLEDSSDEYEEDVIILTPRGSRCEENDEDLEKEVPKHRPRKTAVSIKSVAATAQTKTMCKKAPGPNWISPDWINKGMTYQEVLDIVGVGNLYEVTPIFARRLPIAKSVMSYDSSGNFPTQLIGFDENQVVIALARFSQH